MRLICKYNYLFILKKKKKWKGRESRQLDYSNYGIASVNIILSPVIFGMKHILPQMQIQTLNRSVNLYLSAPDEQWQRIIIIHHQNLLLAFDKINSIFIAVLYLKVTVQYWVKSHTSLQILDCLKNHFGYCR